MITLIPTATPVTPTTLDRLPTEQALLRPVIDAAEETPDAFEAGEAGDFKSGNSTTTWEFGSSLKVSMSTCACSV